MRFDRIVGVILSTFIIVLMVGAYKDSNRSYDNPYEVNSDNAIIADNSISYEKTTFDNEVKHNEEIIDYTNKQSYTVTIDSGDINTYCDGSNASDIKIAEAGYKVNVYFSNTKYGSRTNNMTLKPGEKGYIHVFTSYEGKLPASEVTCNYNIGILAA